MSLTPAVASRIEQLIAPLRDKPEGSAILSDVDGTLAPIVPDPGDAEVPDETRRVLQRLANRFALVGLVSGRRAADARRLVGVGEAAYAGNHGLELMAPGAEGVTLDPAVADRAGAARDFLHGLDLTAIRASGLRPEDKGPIQSLHWRGAPDEASAERLAREVADRARRAGLWPHWGRKVLEVRPVAKIDKGTAVRRLVGGGALQGALFGGDDRTDLDAFRALRSLAAAGDLGVAICIGVASDEAPSELPQEADAVVSGPGEFVEVLEALAPRRAPDAGANPG